jgi:hypothetical protein
MPNDAHEVALAFVVERHVRFVVRDDNRIGGFGSHDLAIFPLPDRLDYLLPAAGTRLLDDADLLAVLICDHLRLGYTVFSK